MAELIQKYYPDFRRTINELQRYSVRGKIDSGILFSLSEANNKELVQTLKGKKFNDMRKWVVNNIDKEPASLFRGIYDILYEALDTKSVPQAILIIAGAGMSVDSGIFTYRGSNGIWEKSIKVGNENYRYSEISSLDMWKNYPELAWGFKGHFYNMMLDSEPHEGYYNLLNFVNKKLNVNYFAT